MDLETRYDKGPEKKRNRGLNPSPKPYYCLSRKKLPLRPCSPLLLFFWKRTAKSRVCDMACVTIPYIKHPHPSFIILLLRRDSSPSLSIHPSIPRASSFTLLHGRGSRSARPERAQLFRSHHCFESWLPVYPLSVARHTASRPTIVLLLIETVRLPRLCAGLIR